MKYYLGAFKKYLEFKGRARRAEYWYFALFNLIFVLIIIKLDRILGTTIANSQLGYLYIIYAIGVIPASLSLSIRRLHDVGKSGWMLLISVIPLIGTIWLFILLVTDSKEGHNEYGPNPKIIHVEAQTEPLAQQPEV